MNPSSKRVALRRASPCGTVGRLLRGFARPTLARVGDTSDPGAGRPSLVRVGLARAGSLATCGADCSPGQVLFSGNFPALMNVTTSSGGGGAGLTYEIPLGRGFPACANFRLTITADLQSKFGGSVTTAVNGFLNDSGLNNFTHTFAFGPPAPTLPMVFFPASTDLLFHTQQASVFPTAAPLWGDFAGPLTNNQSIYFWPAPRFPGFSSGNYNIKNVIINIVTV